MAKEMLINVSEGEECRIALLDNGKLEELYMERTSSTSHVGNIYKGRVTNVEASIQAAFVDFGLGRNGFLHISDLMPTYFGRKGEDIQESVGKKMARRDRPPIQRCLRRGDEIIVQIIKEGIGTKGPTLSTYLSIPGRILVMMPGMGKMGVSKKIEDEEERRRLRQILDSLKPPKGVGFIIRTAGIGKSKVEIQRDLTYLSRLWMLIEKKRESGSGPMELYTEGDLVTRTVRDVFTGDVDRLIVDNEAVAKRVKDVIKITSPRTKNKVEVYNEPIPLFHKYDIERDIEMMYSRHVPLPSGGSLVIDSTEAIVAIDVNSGKFRDHSDAEMTAFKTDMEAAEEIPRQLKLRDLGGVIICDFIDLRYERNRRELEELLHENFKKDRAKTKVLRMSQFGIIEITRQRMRPSLKRSIYFDCPHCKGAGLVKTPESMSLDVMRRLAIAAHNEKVARIELAVCTDVGLFLLNRKRATLAGLETDSRKKIVIRPEPGLGLDEMKLDLYDSRDGIVVIEELGLANTQPPHTTQLGTRPHRGGGRGGERGGRGQSQGRGRGGQQPPPRGRDRDDFELDDAEDAAEEREDRRDRAPADPAVVARIAPTLVHDVPAKGAKPPADIERDDQADEQDQHEEEDDDSAVDVEDGHSEIGERPSGEWDRQGYGDRGGQGGGQHGGRRGRRGGRGGGGGGGGGGGDRGDRPPQQGRGDQQPQPSRGQQSPQNRGGTQQQQRDPQQRDPQPQQRDQQRGNQPPRGQQQPRGNDQQRGNQPPRGQQPPRGNQHPRGQGPPPRQQSPIPSAAAYGEVPDEEDDHNPGNQKPPGKVDPQQPPLGEGEERPRRRRRRGGRRHRRRRERERLESQGLPGGPAPVGENGEPLPQNRDDAGAFEPAHADAGHEDDERDDDEEGEFEGSAPMARKPEPQREPEPEPAPAPQAEAEPADEAPSEPEEKPSRAKKKRPPRKAASAPAAKGRAPKRTPPKKAAAAVIDAPVVKTGSADKHLVADDPIAPVPISRPRSYSDLDDIPDDYD
jgi:ribonuclease E